MHRGGKALVAGSAKGCRVTLMAGVTITLDDAEFSRWLQRTIGSISNPTDALKEIGEVLTQSTKDRFGTKIAPGGATWAANSPVTIAIKGHGSQLRGKSKALGDTIHYQLDGTKAVEVGSNMIYAAVQQFGAKMGQFGRYSQIARYRKYGEKDFRRYAGTKKGFPIPWGDIPPRPFVGVSQEDEDRITEIMADYLLPGH